MNAYPWFDVDSRCATAGGETVVDDEYCCCTDCWTDPDKFDVVEPCCGDGCCCAVCNCADVAFVKLDIDEGEFSPDVDGIDDGS